MFCAVCVYVCVRVCVCVCVCVCVWRQTDRQAGRHLCASLVCRRDPSSYSSSSSSSSSSSYFSSSSSASSSSSSRIALQGVDKSTEDVTSALLETNIDSADPEGVYDFGDETADTRGRGATRGGARTVPSTTADAADLYDMGDDDNNADVAGAADGQDDDENQLEFGFETDDETGEESAFAAMDDAGPSLYGNVVVVGAADDAEAQDHGGSIPPGPPGLQQVTPVHVGARVRVQGYESLGTVAFVGNHHKLGSERVGVVLDAPFGRNNGTVSGHRYFTCEDGHGVLCMPTKVSLLQ